MSLSKLHRIFALRPEITFVGFNYFNVANSTQDVTDYNLFTYTVLKQTLVNAIDRKFLDLLKIKIVNVLRETFPGIPGSMSDWMGSEISHFLDDLQNKVNQKVSEKWFYTHMKTNHKNLPRIDTLNILSQYVGYLDWADFKYHMTKIEQGVDDIHASKPPTDKSNRVFYVVPLLVLAVLLIFILILKFLHVEMI